MYDPVYGTLIVRLVISLPLTQPRPVKKVKIVEVKECTKEEAVKFAVELQISNQWLKHVETEMMWISHPENIEDEVLELTRKQVSSQGSQGTKEK